MKWNEKRLVCSTLVCLIAFCWVPSISAQVDVDDLVRQSTFVFHGTVSKLEAATMKAVPISKQTVIVRVDTVVQGSKMLAGYAGKSITVYVKEPVKVGDHFVFFTTGWLAGNSVAVKEFNRLPVENTENLSEEVARINRQFADQLLRQRIANAELVVTGRVLEVKARPDLSKVRTEHDPKWQEAIIDITSVLKGEASGRSISVFFPGSLDDILAGVPRFNPGQEGIWILHTNEATVKGYTALDQLDLQSQDKAERVKDLIKRFER